MHFNARVQKRTREVQSLVCVGLDVDPAKLPPFLLQKSDPIFTFNKAIIEATTDLVLAYKFNLAFYEALGTEGWEILKKTLDYVPSEIIKIGDGKRGDIGNSSEKYAQALFNLGFDAVTVNPLFGKDGVMPFLKDETRGAFLLCLTSNPGSQDFQYLKANGKIFYEWIAEKALQWNQNNNCGLVVGATHPEELGRIRAIAKELPFLIPGIGAQAGALESSVMEGTDERGEMAIFNSSRAILYASYREDFAQKAREETMRLKASIQKICERKKERSR